jgi:hypothetical protein
MRVSVKKKLADVPKATLLGVLAVILMYVGVAGIVSAVTPWANLSDTKYHIDYIYRLRQGEIPKFSEGIQYPPLKTISKFHLAASHPPFFYMLHAPFLGPLLDGGHWKQAIALGRAINIILGVLCIIALAVAGWMIGGAGRNVMAVAVPAIGALLYRFTTLNVVFGNDVLVVLLATIAFILMYQLLKKGPDYKYLLGLCLVLILGMATRAPFIVIAIVGPMSVVLASAMHFKGSVKRGIMFGVGKAMIIASLVALVVGWFYYRNYEASGSWFKSSPDSFSGRRVYKSLREVITGPKLWALFYAHSSNLPFLATAITSFGAAGYLTMTGGNIKKFIVQHKALVILFSLMLIAVAGVLFTQIRLAVGYGSINFRYLLPVLLPISLFIAYGLTRFKLARGQLVSIAAVLTGMYTILPSAASSTIASYVPDVLKTNSSIGKIFIATSSNGVPSFVTACLLVSFLIGSAILVRSMYKLSRVER